MSILTINTARKIIGKEVKNVSDDDIQKDIEAATMFKDLFFNSLTRSKTKNVALKSPNVP